jgi:hypothetical protein
MSVFQTTEGTQTQSQTQTTNQESWVEKLAKARGEQWKDPEVIAKGKLEADQFITDLQRQVAELREDLGKQDYSKQLLDALQNKATQTTSVNSVENKGGTEEVKTKTNLSEEDLKSLVETTLTQRERNATESQNLQVVEGKLTELYGTEAAAKVLQKSKELGISSKRLEEIAKESPSAFFALIGEKAPETKTFVNGTVNTNSASLQATSDKNWKYYQDLRKKDKRTYFTPEVQRQLMTDRERLGDKFYS